MYLSLLDFEEVNDACKYDLSILNKFMDHSKKIKVYHIKSEVIKQIKDFKKIEEKIKDRSAYH